VGVSEEYFKCLFRIKRDMNCIIVKIKPSVDFDISILPAKLYELNALITEFNTPCGDNGSHDSYTPVASLSAVIGVEVTHRPSTCAGA
jgi:hypothetical protein